MHRWTFARPISGRAEHFLLDDRAGLLGVCGDAWSPKSKVEAAFVSGRALGRALAERLATVAS